MIAADDAEDNLINALLIDTLPVIGGFCPEEFFQHRGVAGVSEVLIEVVLDKVKERQELGVARLFGVLFSPLSDHIQKGEHLLRGDRFQVLSAEFLAEFGKNPRIGPDRVFFRVGLVVLQEHCCYLANVHIFASFWFGVYGSFSAISPKL